MRLEWDEAKRVNNIAERGVDLGMATHPNAPAHPLNADFWASAQVVMPPTSPETPINLRIDQDGSVGSERKARATCPA